MQHHISSVSMALVGLALLSTGASAQIDGSPRLQPVPGVKDAGTYHVATGTWTRGESSLARGDYDVIYDNSCSVGWYLPLEQQAIVDDGRLPSTTSPYNPQVGPMPASNYPLVSFPGTDDSYGVNWYEFAYCTGSAAPITTLTAFYECYTSCEDVTLLTPTATIELSGLPGSPAPGTAIGCWIINIDLLGSTLNFTMNGDCDGSWDGTPMDDNFGYLYMQSTPDPSGQTGPILAGDPDGLQQGGPGGTGCCVGCNTVFWAGPGFPAGVHGTCEEGSGLNNHDLFELDDHQGGYVFTYNGCFWFGGGYSPADRHASFHWKMAGTTSYEPQTEPGTPYCFGHTDQGNPCPCGNDNDQTDPLGAGCENGTFSAGARLWGSGQASVANDTLVLHATRGQPYNSSMFFQARNSLDGAGIYLGDGIRCAGGYVKRLKVQLNDGNGDADTTPIVISLRSAMLGDTLYPGDARTYQWWFRDNPGVCGNRSNTSNGYYIIWLP